MAVGVVLEDGFPAVAAIDDVMDGARIFNANFAVHECGLAQRPASRQRHHNMFILWAVGFLSKYYNTMDPFRPDLHCPNFITAPLSRTVHPAQCVERQKRVYDSVR